MIRLSITVVFAWIASISGAAEYARPELLVESPELFAYIDGRETSFSEAGVILISVAPGSVNGPAWLQGAKVINVAEWKAAFEKNEPVEAWNARVRRVVSNPGATVVLFDNGITPSAARAWWLLKYWGLPDVRLLNVNRDGRHFCAAAIRSMGLPKVAPSDEPFVAKPCAERLAVHDGILGKTACLVDTRSDAEVAGGVIPGAGHAEWSRFVDRTTGKMRPADELASLLDEVGFDPQRPAITYCRTGGRSAVVVFAMELMGGKKVANYHGSWNDWLRQPNAPIARPAAEVTR